MTDKEGVPHVSAPAKRGQDARAPFYSHTSTAVVDAPVDF